MCTAINDNHLFGRTLDLDRTYGESVVMTPRRFPLKFMHQKSVCDHYAIIGAAHVADNIPLYYDAANEKGLCAAALRLPELTCYHKAKPDKQNLASFELIAWLLCNFDNARAARIALENVNITPESFSDKLPSTPLHWLVSDTSSSFVIESTKDGLKIYDNPYGVLTNAPEFPTQCYIFEERGRPMLGDLSSSSRFVRAINAKEHTAPCNNESEAITRFFHIMGTVNQPAGLFQADERNLRTVYTSCIDTKQMIYYFTTYTCRKIHGVKMQNAKIDGTSLTTFPMQQDECIELLN